MVRLHSSYKVGAMFLHKNPLYLTQMIYSNIER